LITINAEFVEEHGIVAGHALAMLGSANSGGSIE